MVWSKQDKDWGGFSGGDLPLNLVSAYWNTNMEPAMSWSAMILPQLITAEDPGKILELDSEIEDATPPPFQRH
jgi:hypothetical protein